MGGGASVTWMAQDEAELHDNPHHAGGIGRRVRRIALIGVAVLAVLAVAVAWFSRERIADTVITAQIETMGLPATYEIESIGARRQVLRNVVVGNPAQPDLTIERVVITLSASLSGAAISAISLESPKLYGSYRKGSLSFGSLDKVLFSGGKTPFRMPQMDLAIIDGRARIETDHGPVGVKASGQGALRGVFFGELAAIAPELSLGACRARQASLYGTVNIESERPRFSGPLRLGGFDCAKDGLSARDAALQLDVTLDKPLDGAEGRFSLRGGAVSVGANRLAASAGSGRFSWRKDLLLLHYALSGKDARSAQVQAAAVDFEGVLRSSDGFSRFDIEGAASARDVRTGHALDQALASAEASGGGTLIAPIAAQLRAALRREAPGSALSAQYVLRRTGDIVNLIVPQANLRGGSGDTLVGLSRVQATLAGSAPPRISGIFSTGGTGLPRITGRMERASPGGLVMHMRMAEYRAGTARVGAPALMLVQTRGGELGFSGRVTLTGDLPGGRAEDLRLPVEGNWSATRGLALWRKCVRLDFRALRFADLTLENRETMLCPQQHGAIVRMDSKGTRVAAGAPRLDLAGRLGSTPIRIASGPVGVAVPGVLAASSLDIRLGPAATASRFTVASLSARIARDVAGTFSGTDVLLAAVPLDIRDAAGKWRFAGGRLALEGAAFRLEDRELDDRFQPLVTQDGTLSLADNRISASATMLEPESKRPIVRADIAHNLSRGAGSADLAFDGIVFDKALQPDMVSRLALGVIANAQGTVRGTGRIDWDETRVTSTGTFSTDSLDFAAAFGPARGLSGTVTFTDLLGVVTAPDQKVRIAAINPGIEVTDGEVMFELKPGSQLLIKGGDWPFLGGTLHLRPATMNFGVAETRRYTLDIAGLDSAKLLSQMELANLSMEGTFDGTIPLVFDENGGRLEGGRLRSRAPGGNLSYVGELSYKDLSAMANFAFDTLRSLDYRSMEVKLDGELEGEIITKVQFDGIRQGEGTRRNFLTERIARLPIRFNVNISAPFFQLVTSLRSMYDPAYVRDPRSLGLIDGQGRPLAPPPAAPPPPKISPIQPADSEAMP